MAAQLVLATAAENGSLVMDDRFAQHLPLVRRVYTDAHSELDL